MNRPTEYDIQDYKEDFIDSYYNNWKPYRTFLSKLILNAEGNDLLDVGCGSPNFGICCRVFGISYLGLDNSDICINECRKNGIAVVKHDLAKGLPDIDKKFDIVCFHGIFEHLPIEVDTELLKGAKKFAKEHTIYSFQIPTHDDAKTTKHRKEVHITIKPYSYWKKLLHENGYDIINNYNWSFGPVYYLLKIFKNLQPDVLISQMNVICKIKSRE